MSFTKKRLIQERNILLEKQYILEQVPPTTGNTTPITTTTTTIKKISNSDLKILPDCSTIDSKIKKQSGYTSNDLTIFLTTDNKPLCTTKK